LTNKNVFNCLLNWQRLSDDPIEAGNLFQSRGPATSNDLSPRRVLYHGMTHVLAPDHRRRRLASGTDLHASERVSCVFFSSQLKTPLYEIYGYGRALLMASLSAPHTCYL